MAFIGLKYFGVALLSTEGTLSAAPTYTDGKIIGKAIRANLTINRNDNPLYADDAVAEDDNSITGLNLEFGIDRLDEADRVKYSGGYKVTGSSGSPDLYYETDAPAPYIGNGYIRVLMVDNVKKYQAVFMYKATMSQNNEETNTKGENVDWQTPTLNIRGIAVPNFAQGSGNLFRVKAEFTTEAAALAWLKGQLGISN